MKRTFLLAALLFSASYTLPAIAEEGKGLDPAKFAEHKARMTAEVDERIAKLQEHKNCIANAQDHEGMKACHASMKSFRESERAEHMERKKMKMERKGGGGPQ